MAPDRPAQLRMHGTLVEVAGLGLLVQGRSGIGKSECALELVMRGHRLVADDVVLVERDDQGRLFGTGPEMVRHYLELRGIGIVHVPSLFGERAVAQRARIELVVRLEEWRRAEVDRLGMTRRCCSIADVEIAELTLPVAPGRNVASLVEVAARNHQLQQTGRSSVAELDHRISETLRRGRP